jgi:spore cortex formation protein SpoVR/YcgB (stage V sporulation)
VVDSELSQPRRAVARASARGRRPARLSYARDTLRNLERIWRRPVSILTVIDDKPKRIRFDGSEISMSDEPHAFRV